MREVIKVEGLREVKHALRKLPDATAKNILRRILKQRGQPIAERARQGVPVDDGQLRDSITVGTRLSKRQKSLHRKVDPDDVEMFVGAGPLPHAHMVEFGSINNEPSLFMTRAWDAERRGVLEGVGQDLWAEIAKAAKRMARKAAKAAAK